MSRDQQKHNAALAALDFVDDNMIIGLGSGSTAEILIDLIGERVAEGLHIAGIPTSERTRRCAERAGIDIIPVEHADRVDLTIDGADEVDPNFRLMKGGGGCLLREKIVAHASDVMVVIIDESKMVEQLGAFPLPVEVDRFGFTITAKKVFDALRDSGCKGADVSLRERSGPRDPFVSDGGHFILDCQCKSIPDPELTARMLTSIPGVVEHGMFLDIARFIVVGGDESAEIIERQ
ncbi:MULTISPECIES: ribose-5-phosphate isomerase RpiA [Euryhalocaulis]|uniref:ribose-5-phosphate isomerase RpiA n=1 Tax=Euryhalocaulis TaxID=1712422 RepID=UPI0003A609F2|nr:MULTISPECIES: ribose-5-phosphate isomerase RpiA [Euryhalocaulis]MBA4800788.1 ribose-5-phosphate isomerase RpiA [Euryhalocaulis sp.]